MVGNDYVFDIEPAKRLGMRTIWVEREDPYAPGAPPVRAPLAADVRITELADVSAVLAALPHPLCPNGNGSDGRPRAVSPSPIRRAKAGQVAARRPVR